MRLKQMDYLILLSSLLTLSTFTHAQSTMNDKLTIVTYNLANYNDHLNWDERLELLATEIQTAHADVVALQEVRFDPGQSSTTRTYQNMAEQLLHKLNQRGDFLEATLATQPVMYYPTNLNDHLGTHQYPMPASLSQHQKSYFWEGLSIIAKPTILETGSYFLSMPANCGDTNKRVTQYAKILKSGKLYNIVNVHFAYATPCAMGNTTETLDYIERITPKNEPLFIVGDYNEKPDSPIFELMRDHNYVDAWQQLHPNDPGYTSSAENPIKRIDYIWANETASRYLNAAAQMSIIGNHAANGLYPSDHYGLALTVQE